MNNYNELEHKDTINSIINDFSDYVKNISPMGLTAEAHLKYATGKTDIILVPFENEDDKYHMMKALGHKAAKENIRRKLEYFTFISEAWMKRFNPDEIPSNKVRVSSYPDKREVLIIMCLHIESKTSLLAALDIKRDSDKRIIELSLEEGFSKIDLKESQLLFDFMEGYDEYFMC